MLDTDTVILMAVCKIKSKGKMLRDLRLRRLESKGALDEVRVFSLDVLSRHCLGVGRDKGFLRQW